MDHNHLGRVGGLDGPVVRHLFVVGDSLAFHGPAAMDAPFHAGLYPQVCAARLAETTGDAVDVDLLARQGWTARDAWWGLTKDPQSFGRYVHRAQWLVLGIGGMDHLPAAVPTWVRESIPYVRTGRIRRRVRSAYQAAAPPVIRWTGGRMRQLPQPMTDRYLTRIAQAVRLYRPSIPIALMGPGEHKSPLYPSDRPHQAAVAAARRWCAQNDVAFVDPDPLVRPSLDDGSGNPDGMHWAWSAHAAVGTALAEALLAAR